MGSDKIKDYLTAYFHNLKTPINLEIAMALRLVDKEVNAVAEHYYSGGSPKSAESVFYFSERTYYRRLAKLTNTVKRLVNEA